jgi:hypothetical protein
VIIRAIAILVVALAVPDVTHGQSISPEEGKRFFERYVRLGDAYDTAVADLYLDTSRITSVRRYPTGIYRTIEIPGHEWRATIRNAMPMARAKGDRSEFKNVRVDVDGRLMRVRADRYPVLKCYWDRGYFMLIARQPDRSLKIVEEYFETQPQSAC